MQQLLSFLLRTSWKMLAVAIATGLFSGGCSAGLIAVISRVISGAANPSSLGVGLSFLGLVMIALLTSIVARVLLVRLSQEAVFQLQMRLCQQILASELSHLETLGTPRLLATLTEDIQAISNAVYALPPLVISMAIVVGGLVYITSLSWKVFLLVMGITAIALGSCRFLIGRGHALLALARDDQDQLFHHFRTITQGIKELKLHYQRRQEFVEQDLHITATNVRYHGELGLTLFSIIDSWGKLIFFFAIGLVLFVLPSQVTLNDQIFAGYVLTCTYLIGPMENIVNKLPLISKARVSLDKIDSLDLSLANQTETKVVPPQANASFQPLELMGITHTYKSGPDDQDFTLGPLDLALYPGELVFIIGGNGSGKSTLAKLITGLYLPEAGEIWLGKQRIDSQNREWYRQHFSVVFFDFYLFERLFGFHQSELESPAQAYLEQLHLAHKVKIEQGRLSTTALSQGQRKRLTLLTAYLEDRPIYLFDEWAADQDPTFKELFYTQFLQGLTHQGKTVLVISHDDHYFHLADRIIKLDYGQIVYDKQ